MSTTHTNVKKTKTGIVMKKSSEQTIVVRVYRTVQDPVVKKYVKKSTNMHVHDPKNEARQGDKVVITECRPMSKNKSWVLKSIVSHDEMFGEVI